MLWLRLAPGAVTLDALACDGCRAATARPAFCDDDDAVPALCKTCVPSAEGRPRCPACARA